MSSRGRIFVLVIAWVSVLLAACNLLFGSEGLVASLHKHGLVWAALLTIMLTSIYQVRLIRQQQRQDEQQQQLLMDSLQVGITVYEQQKGFTYVNQAYADLVGYDPKQLLGQEPKAHTHPDDHVKLTNHHNLHRAGLPSIYHTRLVHRDGGTIPVEINAVPVYILGVVTGTLASVTDLRPLEAKEARGAALNRMLRSAAEATRTLISSHDPNSYARAAAILGAGMGVSRIVVYAYQETSSDSQFIPQNEWTTEELVAMPGRVYKPYQPWMATFEEGLSVVCPAQDFPTELRDCLLASGAQTVIQTPIWVGGGLWGLLWVEDQQDREWGEQETSVLGVIAATVAQVVKQIQLEQALQDPKLPELEIVSAKPQLPSYTLAEPEDEIVDRR